MARKMLADVEPVQPSNHELKGERREFPLSKIKANGWNPNRMSSFMLKSFEQELRETGWLRSMLILVWGTDENGVEKNLIIDGEHRWKIGKKLGFKTVEMVFMNGISEVQAKRLSIRIRKQGTYDFDDLSIFLQDPMIRGGMDLDTFGLTMGFESEELSKLLGQPVPRATPAGTQPSPIKRGPKVMLEFSTVEKRDAFKVFIGKLVEGIEGAVSGDELCTKLRIIEP